MGRTQAYFFSPEKPLNDNLKHDEQPPNSRLSTLSEVLHRGAIDVQHLDLHLFVVEMPAGFPGCSHFVAGTCGGSAAPWETRMKSAAVSAVCSYVVAE